jgi:hypothetical protein
MTCAPDVIKGPEDDLAALSDDALADHIRSFASRISAATCVFLLAVGEYEQRRAWERWECRSMSHWLSWRCGISPVTARQQVRVAVALRELPTVRTEFAAGRLSYSQVRAITRVATPATEEMFTDLAKVMTAGQLEAVTHAFRRSRIAAEETAIQRRTHRTLTWATDDDGSTVGTFRLPPEDAAVLLRALTGRRYPDDFVDADRDRAVDPLGAANADALVEIARADLDRQQTTDADADPGDRYLVAIVAEVAALTPAPHSDRSDCGSAQTSDEGTGELCRLVDGPGLASSTVRRLACDQPTVVIREDGEGNLLNLGRRTRRPNRPLRRALRHRDGDRCRFPGCPGNGVEAHHVTHWLDGGATRLENMVSLCRRHHHRHHEGAFGIEATGDGSFRFSLPFGKIIPTVPPTPTVPAGGQLEGFAAPDACTPIWEGDRLDLPIIIDGLFHADQHGSPPKPPLQT